MKLRVLYFASLRDAAGRDSEEVSTERDDPRALYDELRSRHGLTMAPERIRIAVNGEFARWDRALRDGDEVAFLPPMSGG